MKKFLSLLAISFSILPVAAQDAAKDGNIKTDKSWFEQELYLQNISYGSANPVSISKNPYSVLNTVEASFSHIDGSFHGINEPQDAVLKDFNFYGVKKAGRVSFEGSLQYNIHDLNNTRWGNPVLISENNPFIIADTLVYDSIPNDQNRETFNLNGGFSWQVSDRMALGLRAGYYVGSRADQADPRFFAQAARTGINPGLEYKLSDSFLIGLSMNAQVYHEIVKMSVKDNLLDPAHTIIFLLGEFGNYEVVNTTGYNRRYNGKVYGGSLQTTYTGKKLSDFLEIGVNLNMEEAVDGGTSFEKKGGDFKDMSISFNNRLQISTPGMIHNVGISAGISSISDKKYKQKARYDEFAMEVWDILSSEIVEKDQNVNADLYYRLDLLEEGKSMFTAKINGGIDMVDIKEYPDEYYVKYSLLNVGALVSKRFAFDNIGIDINASGKYVMALNELDCLLPMGTAGRKRISNGYFTPKYQYNGAEYYQACVWAGVSYRLEKGQNIRLGGGYSMSGYLGDYSRFDDRTRFNANLSFTF